MDTPKISLKQVGNETLLNMYYEYRCNLHRYQKILDGKTKIDKQTREYYYDKLIWDGEYFHQIKLEILSRMSGMEID